MSFKYFNIVIIATFIVGCSSSRDEIVKELPNQSQDTAVQQLTIPEEVEEATPPAVEPLLDARKWSPQFIPTGFASGIMVEFTGLKQSAKLNARYAGIELQRVVPDTMLPTTFNLTTTINDLRQAFFKVPPGVYLLRQTKVWAKQSYIRDVEVREGNYSVVTIDVLNPRAPKIQPAADTNNNK